MKNLMVIFLVAFLSVVLMSADDPSTKLADCGDCVESEMDALEGNANVVMGYYRTYDVPEECDESLTWDYGWEGETQILSQDRNSITIAWLECATNPWIDWGRADTDPVCNAKSDKLYITLELGRPTGPTGEEAPGTSTYYNYQATALPTGAESYGWLITGGDYDTQGPTDEDDIDIRFNDSSTTYRIRVRAESSCDDSSYNPGLYVTTGS